MRHRPVIRPARALVVLAAACTSPTTNSGGESQDGTPTADDDTEQGGGGGAEDDGGGTVTGVGLAVADGDGAPAAQLTETASVVCAAVLEGDGPSLSFAWTISGSTIDEPRDTLVGAHFDKDGALSCTVTGLDPAGTESSATSALLQVANSPPTITVTLDPTDAPAGSGGLVGVAGGGGGSGPGGRKGETRQQQGEGAGECRRRKGSQAEARVCGRLCVTHGPIRWVPCPLPPREPP